MTSLIIREFALHVILQWFSKGEDLENLLSGNCKFQVLYILKSFLKVSDPNNVVCSSVIVLLHLKRSFMERSKFKSILEEPESLSKLLDLKKQFESMIEEPLQGSGNFDLLINMLKKSKDSTERELIIDIITSLPSKVLKMISNRSMSYIIELAKSMEIEKSDENDIHWADKITTPISVNRAGTEQKKCIQCLCEKLDEKVSQLLADFSYWVIETKGVFRDSISVFIECFERYGIDNDKLSQEQQATNLVRLLSRMKFLSESGFTLPKSLGEFINRRKNIVMFIKSNDEMRVYFIEHFGEKYLTIGQENQINTPKTDQELFKYVKPTINSSSISMLISQNLDFETQQKAQQFETTLQDIRQDSDSDVIMHDEFNLPIVCSSSDIMPSSNTHPPATHQTVNLLTNGLLNENGYNTRLEKQEPQVIQPLKVQSFRKSCEIESFPFQGDFTFVQEITSSLFSNVSDVKISYKNKYIIVSNSNNGKNQLLFFDLNTKELKKNISFFDNINGIAIERNFDGRNDAIILSTEEKVLKFDISKLVLNGTDKNYLWSKKLEITSRFAVKNAKLAALTILHSPHTEKKVENVVFVCDTSFNCIHILRSSDGKILKRIGGINSTDKMSMFHPNWIDIDRESSELVISETMSNNVRVLLESSETKTIETRCLPTKFKQVGGIVYDNYTKNIIVSDVIENSIQIFNAIGNRVNILAGQVHHPKSLCINEETGELYVNDSGNKRIVIYK
ncbi:hypothetical protein NAEGRDRAFT_79394 [Naegleria gruberi]|uniref:Uncharacterized protein n=1 Tax=Naegleria gruberi TaxID=5762 RepID=D2VC58_NAEGR|nr:uncharacterized protein NAEGRDRAFT_79394 [Naegleria gruberi]EFC45600.1 hypothetical protein NAEGRDRAFT_79394 [Naegleria gruberi]|eukprot:XP_002678344.1 hypothetical protein NAEGRDRAFT_79394 [Naegleria gruberi strain NEG-M]